MQDLTNQWHSDVEGGKLSDERDCDESSLWNCEHGLWDQSVSGSFVRAAKNLVQMVDYTIFGILCGLQW